MSFDPSLLWGYEWLLAFYGVYLVALPQWRHIDSESLRRLLVRVILMWIAIGVTSQIPELWLIRRTSPLFYILQSNWLATLFTGSLMVETEESFLRCDRVIFNSFGLNKLIIILPQWILELIEFAYLFAYGSVPLCLMLVMGEEEHVKFFWSSVLSAGLICYACQPWFCLRPPRMLDNDYPINRRVSVFRHLNLLLLALTESNEDMIPSGHVATALAQAMVILQVSWLWGKLMSLLALGVIIATILGRYHYIVDVIWGIVAGLIGYSAALRMC